MKYRIAWKHVETGKVGRGKAIFSSREVAEEVAIQMDQVWQEMEHWAEPAEHQAQSILATTTSA